MSHLSGVSAAMSGYQLENITMCGRANNLVPPSYFPLKTNPSLIDSIDA